MKNLFKILCGLSIVGLATVACSKEVEQDVAPETPAVSKHSVKVTAGLSAETKTVMLSSGDQTKWTDGDIANMHFFENGIAPEASTVKLNSENTELTITADFANTSATKYVYTSILASNLDSEKNAILDDEQYLFKDTFDPLADILVAYPEEFNASQSPAEFTMQYKRVVAVNKIKIKGLAEGDKISSVTISSNKPILGSYSMTNDAWANSGNELLLTAYDDIVVPESGEVSLWFITAPVSDATLSIYVETDNHKYEKDFTKTISFAANTVTAFATTVEGKEVVVNTGTDDYIRVESTSDLTSGEYVLITETAGKIFTGFSSTSTVYGLGDDIDIETDNKILKANVNTDYVLTIEPASVTSGAYVIKLGSSFFNWSSGNSLSSSNTESANTNWNITISDGDAVITNVGDSNRQIWWNVSNPRFACYTGKSEGTSYNITQLYKKDEGGVTKSPLAKPVVTLSKTENLKGIVVAWTDVTKAANYTVACTGQTSQNIAQGVQTATFANLEPGIYTVTVTANPANTDRNTATTSDEGSLEILNYNLPAPTMTFVAGEDNIVVSWTEVPNASSYTYTVLNGETVIVDETNTENLTFTASGLSDNTTYTFKIKSIGETPFISSDYREQTQKTLKSALRSIAEIKYELANGATTYEANVTNAIITGKYTASSTAYAYIQDATAGILIQDASAFDVGDSFTGRISGNMTTYKNQPELTSVNVSLATKTSGVTIPEPTVVTIAELNANIEDYDGRLCKIVKSKAETTLATGNNKSVTISQGENDIKLFTRASYAANTVLQDGYYDVIGYPAEYDGANEIVVIETGKITESPITWQLKSIAVATQPTKRKYTVGDSFDPTGLIISTVVEDADDASIYKNGENVAYSGNESDFSFDPDLSEELTTSNTSVTITYGGKETSQSITVHSADEPIAGDTKTYSIASGTSNAGSFNKLFGGTTNNAITVNHVTNKSITINSDVWSISTSGNGTQIYVSGQQLGAAKSNNVSRDITSLEMSTSAYTDGISTVTVNTKSNGTTSLSLYINDVLVETKNLTNSFKDYSFTLSSITKGTIKLVWSNSLADKNICVASIKIN